MISKKERLAFERFIFDLIDAYAIRAMKHGDPGLSPLERWEKAISFICKEMEEGLYENPLSSRDFLLKFMLGFDRNRELAKRAPCLKKGDVIDSDGDIPSEEEEEEKEEEREERERRNPWALEAGYIPERIGPEEIHDDDCPGRLVSALKWSEIRKWDIFCDDGFRMSCLEYNPHFDIVSTDPLDESYWKAFSSHQAISIEAVLRFPDKPWDWAKLSSNPSISEQDKLSHPSLPWEAAPSPMRKLSSSNALLFSDVLDHLDKEWDWKEISKNEFEHQMWMVRRYPENWEE